MSDEPIAIPEFTFTLNGEEITIAADPKTSVLDVLRDSLGVLTMKAGCSPQGLCGCCTALIDGKPRLTCTLPVKSLAGKSVTTLEAVDPLVRDALALAFTQEGGTQCGYCTPGIALSASVLLAPGPSQNLNPTDEELHRALAPHLCRCTGYTGILDSLRLAACALRGECTIPDSPRPEAREQVLGDRPFVDDLVRPDMLHAVLVWAPGPIGDVEVDLPQEALRLRSRVVDVGEPVAVVWGETPALVKRRARDAKVRFTPDGRSGEAAGGVVVAPAAAGPGVHVEARVRMASTDPVYLEPEAVLAVPDTAGARPTITLYTASQRPAAELAAVRGALAATGAQVRSRVLPSGGSYGGKTSTVLAIVAAQAAIATGRPVRLSLDLEEGLRVHPRRSGGEAAVTVTGTKTGVVKGISGAGGVTSGWTAGDAYAAPSAFHAVAGPGVRGEGLGLATLATERAIDGFARATQKDAFGVRRAAAGPVAKVLLDALSGVWEREGEPPASHLHRGCAISCGGTGFGAVRVALEVASGAEVEVRCNVPELGQGRDAALVRIIARETGLAPGVFTVAWGDPDATGDDAWGPVEGAAARAAEGLAALGGSLGEHVGVTIVGGADPAPPGTAAVVVLLGAEGQVTEVHVAVPCGDDQDPLDVRRVAEGAAHMGVGAALSEEVATVTGEVGPMPETRFRMLGVLKSKVSPRIVGHVVVGGPPVDSADAAFSATAAAVANAVSAFEGSGRASLPMKDSAAARAVGVRVKPS